MNSVNFTGHLGAKPKLVEYKEGKHVAELRLAINNGSHDATWIDVKVYNGGAKACAEHLETGSKVAFTGSLREESWTDEAGKPHSKHVAVGHVEFLDKKPTE